MGKKTEKNVLVVEGKDEVNFFGALLETIGIGDVQIIDVGGEANFKNKFPTFIQTDGALEKMRNIGFIRDAEGHEATAAFQSICHLLRKYGLPCPSERGKIAEQDGKKVNIRFAD